MILSPLPPAFTAELAILAQESQIAGLGSRFRSGGNNVQLGEILVLAAILAIVVISVVVIAWLFHLKERRGYHSHRGLFLELCRVHRLSRSERRLIRKLARQAQLATAADLFLRPDCLDPAEPHTAQLRERLFG